MVMNADKYRAHTDAKIYLSLEPRLAPVLKTIFHQCVISYTCSQSNSDGSVLLALTDVPGIPCCKEDISTPQQTETTFSVSSASYQLDFPDLGQMKKIPVFRIFTRPYINFLVKPRIFSGFLEKIYNFMHFERRNAFQNV